MGKLLMLLAHDYNRNGSNNSKEDGVLWCSQKIYMEKYPEKLTTRSSLKLR